MIKECPSFKNVDLYCKVDTPNSGHIYNNYNKKFLANHKNNYHMVLVYLQLLSINIKSFVNILPLNLQSVKIL